MAHPQTTERISLLRSVLSDLTNFFELHFAPTTPTKRTWLVGLNSVTDFLILRREEWGWAEKATTTVTPHTPSRPSVRPRPSASVRLAPRVRALRLRVVHRRAVWRLACRVGRCRLPGPAQWLIWSSDAQIAPVQMNSETGFFSIPDLNADRWTSHPHHPRHALPLPQPEVSRSRTTYQGQAYNFLSQPEIITVCLTE